MISARGKVWLFQIGFWLGLLLLVGLGMRYWLSTEEENCLRHCAAQGLRGEYKQPRVRSGVKFARRASQPGNCECRAAAP